MLEISGWGRVRGNGGGDRVHPASRQKYKGRKTNLGRGKKKKKKSETKKKSSQRNSIGKKSGNLLVEILLKDET